MSPSATPRCDAQLLWVSTEMPPHVPLAFAKELETELVNARKLIAAVKSHPYLPQSLAALIERMEGEQ